MASCTPILWDSLFRKNANRFHALVDLLTPAKLGVLRNLIEAMIGDDNEHLTAQDRIAIQAGLDSLDKNGSVSMETVLADFGLTISDLEKLSANSDSGTKN